MNRRGSVNKNQNRINVKFMRFDWWELVDSNHRSKRSRFTVCPLWPLGKAPIFNCKFH